MPGIYSHKYTKIKTNLLMIYLQKKTLNMHNVVILTKSVFNKNHQNYFMIELMLLKVFVLISQLHLSKVLLCSYNIGVVGNN